MRDLGKISSPTLNFGSGGSVPNMKLITDAALASGQSALISELEKRDPLLREPLTSVTYPRDIPIITGGGWVDTLSATSINFGVSGGSGDAAIASSASTDTRVIQANISNDKWGAHVYTALMRLPFYDVQRAKLTGRNLDQHYTEGIRLDYDKHMEQNTYIGMPSINTYGILNTPNVTARLVKANAGGKTSFVDKTADEILADFNSALITIWNQAENSLDALPNHVLLPYTQYNHLATTKVSQAADKTILTFIRENNIVKENGVDLFIGATSFNKGAGIGSTDRMVVYVHHERFLSEEELVSLHRAMTAPNIDKMSYDSAYSANISEVMMHYYETIGYFDGI